MVLMFGNTVTTNITSEIISDPQNIYEFDIYYSEKEEATENLDDIENGWTKVPQDMSKVRSYLIIPHDENYVLYKSDIIKFSYNFEIPSNLKNEEKISGTFMVFDRNESIIGEYDEKIYSDKVEIETKANSKFEISLATESEEVRENEEFDIDVKIKNVGESVAQGIKITMPLPSYADYVDSIYIDELQPNIVNDGQNIVITLPQIDINQEALIMLKFKARSLDEIDSENVEIEFVAKLEALNQSIIVNSEPIRIKIVESKLIFEVKNVDAEENRTYMYSNYIPMYIRLKNISKEDMENLKLVTHIPENFTFLSSYDFNTKEDIGIFDESTRELTIDIENLGINEERTYGYHIELTSFSENKTSDFVLLGSKVVFRNNESFSSNEVRIDFAKSDLDIEQISDVSNTYLNDEDIVTFNVKISNSGSAYAGNVILEDKVTDGMEIIGYEYVSEGNLIKKENISENSIIESIYVEAGSQVDIKIHAIVNGNIDEEEKTVTNSANIYTEDEGLINSNDISYVIEKKAKDINVNENIFEPEGIEEEPINEENTQIEDVYIGDVLEEANDQNEVGQSATVISENKEKIEKTYRINGTIWEDVNKNGANDDEGKIDDYDKMEVLLVNANDGVIKQKIGVNNVGFYNFSGVESGEYYIILEYNTKKYGITTYKKDGISGISNSDFMPSKVEKDGVYVNVAITDTIIVNEKSVSNIDIGLIHADIFDLELQNVITKITTQNSSVTNTTFEDVSLAKEEIMPSELKDSTVYVEYTLKVKNTGKVAGYAKKIVDFVPNDMEFNSSIKENIKWYGGNDGNLYTNVLENELIVPGEQKEVKLVLSKKMTEDNTGIVGNLAEIYEDYNIYGISDFDSIAGNHCESEDDSSNSDVIITISTGAKMARTILAIIGATIMVVIVYTLHLKRKRYIQNKNNDSEGEV